MKNSFSLSNALITSALTVAGGLIVFIFGQLFLKFIIEPYSNYQKVKAEISKALIFYANIYSNPVETSVISKYDDIRKELKDIQKEIRTLAAELSGVSQTIPLYHVFAEFNLVPKKKDILKAASNLIGISNSLSANEDSTHFYIDQNLKRRDEIEKILKLYQPV